MTQTHSSSERSRRLPRSARREQLLGAAQEVFVARATTRPRWTTSPSAPGSASRCSTSTSRASSSSTSRCSTSTPTPSSVRVRDALESTTDNHDRVFGCVQVYFDFVDEPGRRVPPGLRVRPAQRADRPGAGRAVAAALRRGDRRHDRPRHRASTATRPSCCPAASPVRPRSARGGGSTPAARSRKQRAIELIQALAWRGISGYPRRGVRHRLTPAFAVGSTGVRCP